MKSGNKKAPPDITVVSVRDPDERRETLARAVRISRKNKKNAASTANQPTAIPSAVTTNVIPAATDSKTEKTTQNGYAEESKAAVIFHNNDNLLFNRINRGRSCAVAINQKDVLRFLNNNPQLLIGPNVDLIMNQLKESKKNAEATTTPAPQVNSVNPSDSSAGATTENSTNNMAHRR